MSIVRKRHTKTGKDKVGEHGTLVVSVDLSLLDAMKRRKMEFGFWKGGLSYRFRGRFEYDVFVPFCSKCNKWGHFASKCKDTERKDEDSAGKGCVNCGGNHQPWNRSKCSAYLKIVDKGISDVNKLLRKFRLASRG